MYEDNPYLQDPQELLHFRNHLAALTNYHQDNEPTYRKVASSNAGDNLFITNMLHKRSQRLQQLVALNQQFLTNLKPNSEQGPLPSTVNNIGKVRSTLRQFYREWCQQSPERQKYTHLVKLFKKYKPKGKVLLPGCGLGRIVLEFVRAGYSAEGNEVSYFMLFGSEYILNSVNLRNSIEIAPFIHNLSGYNSMDDPLRTIRIPDIVAAEQVPPECDFSMKAGQFVQIYASQESVWDGVVTCFFMDTASNIFKYVDTIWRILKEDGVWVNYGPLLYHFRDNLKETSVEISWQSLREYVLGLFDILEQGVDESTYCHDPKSVSKLVYRCRQFVAVKKTKQNEE